MNIIKNAMYGGFVAGEIIRLGDRTSHGGTVIEGSQADVCMGQPIAYLGHKVFCPKCKGNFPIVEGVMTTTFYGKGVAVAGMKTSCGATLIAGQFTDIVEWSGGGALLKGGNKASASIFDGAADLGSAHKGSAESVFGMAALGSGARAAEAIFDEQFKLLDDDENILASMPYTVQLSDGALVHGTTDAEGRTARYATAGEQAIQIFLGHI